MTAMRLPFSVTPVTSKSGPPIITSRWIVERFRPRVLCGRVPPKPAPNAMCAAAFSSSSVWKYVRPLRPMREVASTSATSPSLRPLPVGSLSMYDATNVRSSSSSASSRTSRPFENSPRRPWISLPWNVSGNVHAKVPFVPAACGLVNDSSVGMFGAILAPRGELGVSRVEPHVELRSGAAQLEGREREPGQLRRAPRDRAHMVEPAGRTLAVVVGEPAEPQEVLGELPLSLERRKLGIHL